MDCYLLVRQVPEDYPVNEPLFVVRADDADRGNNAELSYILETASQLQYGQIFRLHRTTGEVQTTSSAAAAEIARHATLKHLRVIITQTTHLQP